jgi:hypothetical protein
VLLEAHLAHDPERFIPRIPRMDDDRQVRLAPKLYLALEHLDLHVMR